MKKTYILFLLFVVSLASKAQNLATTMTVSPGTAMCISSGTTVYAANVNLESTSSKYAILLLDGDLGGSSIVNYDRYVNIHGTSGVNGGNDLISMPVKEAGTVTFGDFLNYSQDGGTTKNADIIRNSATTPSLYLFGPYNTSGRAYVNYDSSADATKTLTRGKGYRAATESGQTIRFTGTVSKNTETINIVTSNTNYWNLIGNPYPSYIDSQAFLTENSAVLDPNAVAIYGYNSGILPTSGSIDNFTIINNLTNSSINIAPGQGFLVANNRTVPSSQISFTTAMRTLVGQDDFILGRNIMPNQMVRLRAADATAHFATEIYFNENSTSGLDPGYDAELFGGSTSNVMLYSQLVDNNVGRNMAIQSLGFVNLTDVVIPLGLKASQGRQVTISIESSTLEPGTQVYLEDNLTNTSTLLNTNEYIFTTNSAMNGTGRFFLRIGESTLSNTDPDSNSLKMFASEKTIFINGQLLADTSVAVYDIQGRLVLTTHLESGSDKNKIETNNLNSGIYVVKLTNEKQSQTKKVVIK